MLKALLDRTVRLFLKELFEKQGRIQKEIMPAETGKMISENPEKPKNAEPRDSEASKKEKQESACFLVGVSGGADSISLLNTLAKQRKAFGYRLVAVHINHMLRGEEADGDEEYVKRFCEERAVPFDCYHKEVAELAKKEGLSLEEAGRRVRYECFAESAKKHGAAGLFIAHNRDDAAETVLFNLLRGASLSGLAGIKSSSEQNGLKIYRPLLTLGRDEIEAYLMEEGISFRTDSTNLGTDYTRNKIRHVLLPELEKINPGARRHLLRLSNEAAETEEYLLGQTLAAKKECFDTEKEALDAKKFALLPAVIKKRLAHILISEAAGKKKDIAEIHVNDFCSLANRENGKRISLPYGLTAEKKNSYIFISKG